MTQMQSPNSQYVNRLYTNGARNLLATTKLSSLSPACPKTLNFKAAADGIPRREVHICHPLTSLCLTHFKIALRAQRLLKDEALNMKLLRK